MPANSSGRMYFYLGSQNSKYFDFIEFTVGTDSINVDTTRVDRFGLKLALLAHSHSGQTQEVGEDYATFKESRAATFARFEAFVPGPVQGARHHRRPVRHPLARQRPRVPAGRQVRELLHRLRVRPRRKGRHHRRRLRLRRHAVGQPPAVRRPQPPRRPAAGVRQSNPADFYKAGPANYYAEFWHENAINGKQYGFPYDDDASQSSDISVANPEYMIVAVGW